MRRRTASAAIVILSATLSACGSGGGKTVIEKTVIERTRTPSSSAASSPPVAPPADTTPAPASAPPLHLDGFTTPSKNIGCVMLGGEARCDIKSRSWSPPPRPASCPLDYGQGLSVSTRGHGHFVCAGDTTLNPSGPVLPYGSDSRIGNLTCASRTAGMTCRSAASGHGFFLSRGTFRTF